jgi:glycerophosphoryl diester phosphodiesterase
MELNSKRRKLLSGLLAGGLMQGCAGGGNTSSGPAMDGPVATGPAVALPQDGPGVQPVPASSRPLPSLAVLDGSPLYIAHRGAAALYPEETYTAYDNCIGHGQLFLEGDVRSLGDGTLVMMHDETVDRTTSATGLVSSFDKASWDSLRVDADTWHGSHFGSQLAAVRFVDWINRYKRTSLLMPEDKDQRSMAGMLAVLAAEGVRKDQVLIQCFGLAPLQRAAAEGYNTCALVSSGGPEAAVAAGVHWAGIQMNMGEADIRAWVASGLSVLVWTVDRRYERDKKLSLGVKGFISNDPIYLSATAPLRNTDRFEDATWLPGMLPNSGELIGSARGKFMAGGYWGYDDTSSSYLGCLQGYLCPIKSQSQPSFYSLALSVRYGPAANNDLTRWASAFIGTDDREFLDSNESTSGYHFLFRKNGSVEIFKKTPGQRAVLLASRGGTAVNEGDEARFRIDVDGPVLKVSRLTESGTEAYGVMVTDNAYRGAYVSLGRNGLACAFRRIAIA